MACIVLPLELICAEQSKQASAIFVLQFLSFRSILAERKNDVATVFISAMSSGFSRRKVSRTLFQAHSLRAVQVPWSAAIAVR